MTAQQKKKKKVVPTDIPIVWVNVLETADGSDPFL